MRLLVRHEGRIEMALDIAGGTPPLYVYYDIMISSDECILS